MFVVPEGIDLAGVYTSPVSGQLIQLADLESAATLSQGSRRDAESAEAPAASTLASEACDGARAVADGDA